MSIPSRFGQGQMGTLKSLVEESLVLLKLAEVRTPMQTKSQATQAKQSVENLLSALQNSENLAVSIYEGEVEKIRAEVKNTDWNKYRR